MWANTGRYRYGWRFSSNMPDVYISRAGMENHDLDVKFTKTEIGDLKDDLTKLQQETKIKDDRIARLEQSLTDLQANCPAFDNILTSAGLKIVTVPLQSPNLNAFAERSVQSIKMECLDR